MYLAVHTSPRLVRLLNDERLYYKKYFFLITRGHKKRSHLVSKALCKHEVSKQQLSGLPPHGEISAVLLIRRPALM